MLSPVSAYNWTGIYVGANAGYGWGNQNPLGLIAPQFGQNNSFNINGGMFGGTVGGQVQVNHVVLGLEADGDWAWNQRVVDRVDPAPTRHYLAPRFAERRFVHREIADRLCG